METLNLELYTIHELVEELLRRKTFLGVVVHSEDDYKNKQWYGERVFKVRFNENLETEQAFRLLGTVANRLDSELDYEAD